MPPPKKTVIQKDGMLHIVDHPAFSKEKCQEQKREDNKQTLYKQHKQPRDIISQCYMNHKKLGVTYPDNIQSQFKLLETC